MKPEDRRQFQAHDRAAGAAAPPGAGPDAALFARAGAALQARRFEEAEALFREVLAADPGNADAENWLGVACQQLGKGDEAIAHLRKAVELAPAAAEYANNLGIAELKREDFEAACKSFEQALALDPRLAQAHYNLGLALQKLRRPGRAIPCFRQALALVPNYGNAQLSLANALSDVGEHDEAIAILQRLAGAAPDVPAVLFNLATALKNARRYEEAGEVARRILAQDPDSATGHNIMAMFQWSIGRLAEAETSARRAIALDPGLADGHCTLGLVLAAAGRFDEAAANFEAALALVPDYPEALYELALNSKERSSPELVARFEAALAVERPAQAKASLYFGLAKVLDDLGRYAEAFESYRAGNDLIAARHAFDAAGWAAIVDRLIATFTPKFFEARKSYGDESRRPVFIVGMPRSGTTLVEQILASHPDVAAGGELEVMSDIAKGLPLRLPAATPYLAWLPEMDAALSRALATRYLTALDGVDKEAGRVTDKLPGNFMNLALIALLFPRAAIIHCRRDPMDTCLSCYFAKFGAHLPYTFSLDRLGAFYRGYARLMDHWRAVLPVPILDVQYEDLIADQEGVSRNLVAHCGLEWDDRCLQFHKTEREVLTASMWQVRQPIYKRAVGRWRNYEPFLEPLRAALEGAERP